MKRTAYINKENRVVYIAAFEEDRIQADSKGKFRFGGSQWDGEKYIHSLGSGEEVFAVDGSGLGLGDTYTPPAHSVEPIQEPAQKSLQEAINAKKAELDTVRKQILDAQADEDETLLAELRPQRDRLKQELGVLEKEFSNGF